MHKHQTDIGSLKCILRIEIIQKLFTLLKRKLSVESSDNQTIYQYSFEYAQFISSFHVYKLFVYYI